MSYGLKVFSGTNETRLDPSSRTLRMVALEVRDENDGSGSIYVPNFSIHRGFISVQPSGTNSLEWWSWSESDKELYYNISSGAVYFYFVETTS